MDLKTFVAETLNQILAGVAEAAVTDRVQGGTINPALHANLPQLTTHGLFQTKEGIAQLVQFDVAITATEGTGTKGGIGVSVASFKLGASGESNQASSATNRVRFCVPVTLPSVEDQRLE